jgi:hypothetical protein
MQGSRMETAVQGLMRLLDVLRPTDLCGVSTFSTQVQTLHRVMQRSKVDAAKDAAHVRANTARGGATAFYDAVVEGIESLKQAKDYLRSRQDRQCMPEFEHVCITDGGDNSSRASFAEVAALVARPGLHDYQFVVIGVGIDDSTAAALARLCSPAHAHFHREADATALARRLSSLTESYRIKLSQTRADGSRSTITKTTDSKAQFAAIQGAALQVLAGQVQQLALGGGGGGGGRRALPYAGGGGGGGGGAAVTCKFDRQCTRGAACTRTHSMAICFHDGSCHHKARGQCKFRHTR